MKRLISIDKLRKDSIASGLVVALISFIVGQLATFAYNLFVKDFSWGEAYESSTAWLDNELKIKWVMLAVILTIPFYSLFRRVRNKLSNDPHRYVDYKSVIGEYKSGELYNLLISTEFEIPTRFYSTGIQKMNLVQLFILYQKYFNMGVRWNHAGEDGHYMYYKLGPKLMSFGITNKVVRKVRFSTTDNEEEEVIETSENGYKFFAFAEKIRLYTEVYPEYEKELKSAENTSENNAR